MQRHTHTSIKITHTHTPPLCSAHSHMLSAWTNTFPSTCALSLSSLFLSLLIALPPLSSSFLDFLFFFFSLSCFYITLTILRSRLINKKTCCCRCVDVRGPTVCVSVFPCSYACRRKSRKTGSECPHGEADHF